MSVHEMTLIGAGAFIKLCSEQTLALDTDLRLCQGKDLSLTVTRNQIVYQNIANIGSHVRPFLLLPVSSKHD